jgi:hypothetical protein
MYGAMGWSKLYRGFEKQDTGKQMPGAFFTSAQSLLASVQTAGKKNTIIKIFIISMLQLLVQYCCWF